MANTALHYLYRDARNYKAGTRVVLAGAPDAAGIAAITAALDGGEFFIPSQVGLRDLQRDLSPRLYEDDHVWHELQAGADITATEDPATESFGFAELVERFRTVTWDVEQAAIDVGLGEDEHQEAEPGPPVPMPARRHSLRESLRPRG